MKTTLFALCLLCAASAFGQSAPILSNTPQPTIMADHPLRAVVHAMRDETSLVEGSMYGYEKGERPLWDFGPSDKKEIPLGDVARAYRKGHVLDRKAAKVTEITN